MQVFLDHYSLITDDEISIDQIFSRIESFLTLIHKLAKVRGYTIFLKASTFEIARVSPAYSFKTLLQRMFEERRQGESFDRMTLFQAILNSADKWDEFLRTRFDGYICLDKDGHDCSHTIFACAAFSGGVVVSWLAEPSILQQEIELWVAYNDFDDPHQVLVERVISENQIGRFCRGGRHRYGEKAFTDAELRRRSNRSRGSDFDLENEDAQYVLNLGMADDRQLPQYARLIKAVYRGQIYCFVFNQAEDRSQAIIGYSDKTQNFYEYRYDNMGGYHGYIIKPNWESRLRNTFIRQIQANRRICD